MLQRGAAAVGIGELALRDAAGLDEEGQEVPRRHDAAADVADAVRGEQDGRSEAQHPVAVLLGGGESTGRRGPVARPSAARRPQTTRDLSPRAEGANTDRRNSTQLCSSDRFSFGPWR